MQVTNQPVLTPQQRSVPELQWVDSMARLLDTRFRIPGTNIRFGLDFLLGLVPFAGDTLTMLMSGGLVVAMARHGVSGKVLAKMLGNVALDATIGAIPIIGDLFDLTYKANYRNLQLMREYYDEGRHQGSAKPYIIGALIGVIVIVAVVVFLIWQVLEWLWNTVI